MDDATRQLRYLPLFHQDLDQATEYIAHTLGNPKAALDLLDSVESAILERLPVAESFEPYPSIKDREQTYYRIYVGNYIIYYVLLEEDDISVMEVRRFLYKGRNRRIMI